MAVKDWSSTASSNTSILAGITLDGSVMTPPQVDNAFREMAAQIASQLGKVGFEGADIASATTTDLATATGWSIDITGTTTITGFGTVDAGQVFFLRFTGALTLTHNATSLILPGAANITTAAGDVAIMKSEGSGNWKCVAYQRASGQAVVQKAPTRQLITANGDWTRPAGCRWIIAEAVGGGGGSGAVTGGAGLAGATGGGGSGYYGMTPLIDVSAISSAAVTIGAGGAAGVIATSDGGNGGATAITLSGTTYTWGGGSGSVNKAALSTVWTVGAPGGGGVGTNVTPGQSFHGLPGFASSSSDNAEGGHGGYTPMGGGGYGTAIFTTGTAAAQAGFNYGGGASGAASVRSSSVNGAAGAGGAMRVWEFY